MRNSPKLPILSLYLAAAITVLLVGTTSRGERVPLTEIELGLVAGAVTLAVYGLQGLISIAVEGVELVPGRRGPLLTGPLSVSIVLLSIALFVVAVALGWGIADDWEERTIGILAGLGSLILALLLMFYKEAFLGDEARFDDRDDGVPW
jgi:hypothetical protein